MEYIKEQVEGMLKEYKINEAKLTELQLKQEEYQERLLYAGTVYQDSKDEIIENMQLAGQAYDSVNSRTNKISDKVFSTTITYKNEEKHINKENRQFLENKLTEIEKQKDILNKKIVRVKNMLNALNTEQKFIITSYYLEKSKWDYVAKQYFEEYSKPKSINQLLNIRDEAIDIMLKVINTAS